MIILQLVLERLTFTHKALGSNLRLTDERSNCETSRRIGYYSVYLVSLPRPTVMSLHTFKYILNKLTSAPQISILVKSGLRLPTYASCANCSMLKPAVAEAWALERIQKIWGEGCSLKLD